MNPRMLRERIARWRHLFVAAPLVTLCLLGPSRSEAALIYGFVPYVIPGGYTVLGGTITVVDTAAANGTLESSEILDFAVEGTDLLGPFTISGPVNSLVSTGGTIGITASEIFVAAGKSNVVHSFTLASDDAIVSIRWSSGSLCDYACFTASLVSVKNRGTAQSGFFYFPTVVPVPVATRVVPEPSGALLLGTGLVALAARRRSSPDYSRPGA